MAGDGYGDFCSKDDVSFFLCKTCRQGNLPACYTFGTFFNFSKLLKSVISKDNNFQLMKKEAGL